MTDDRAKELTNTELFMKGIGRMASEAREDVEKFYSFVIREENTKKKLEPSAHQKLHFSFIDWHKRSVTRMPVGHGKTFDTATYALWTLGRDPTQRGLIVSDTVTQARKPLRMVSEYIEEPELSKMLALVFPNLQPRVRAKESWSQTEITVHRPPGIRDASLVAAGINSKILGSRLSFILVDDMISYQNSRTKDFRDEVRNNFEGTLMSRLPPTGGRVMVTNTPWDKNDQTYILENNGWPTLTMDVYGNIRVTNADAAWMHFALKKYLRPSTKKENRRYQWYRLKEYDPDPEELTVLFPELYTLETIQQMKREKMPQEFARSFLCEPMSEEGGRCKREWIEKCKFQGIGKSLVSRYDGPNPTYTGVDLGIGQSRKHDQTVAITIEVKPDGKLRLLDIDSRRLKGPEIVDMVIGKHHSYKSEIRVEGNQAQEYISQFAKKEKKTLPIRSIATTTVNKYHQEFGVEAIYKELEEGKWIIPCDEHNASCSKEVQGLIDDLMYYDPLKHTPDRLMAMWMAREASRKRHGTDPKPRAGLRRLMPSAAGF